jgi:hypothetical protein
VEGALGSVAGLDEAARLHWREDASERTLRRDGRRWSAWTAWIVLVFTAPGLALLAIEPLTAPVAALCFAHAWAIPWIQARRGARQVMPIGGERSAAGRAEADPEAERVALGLLADLVGHSARELLGASGLALERGEDELGFAKVANLGFSGAAWRVRRELPRRSRPALDAARRELRSRAATPPGRARARPAA